MHQNLHSGHFGKVPGKLLQKFRVVYDVSSYLYYFDHSSLRISLRMVWAETTLFAASGITID